jgi:hypothetical protein
MQDEINQVIEAISQSWNQRPRVADLPPACVRVAAPGQGGLAYANRKLPDFFEKGEGGTGALRQGAQDSWPA